MVDRKGSGLNFGGESGSSDEDKLLHERWWFS
jgi:hypothetical protein